MPFPEYIATRPTSVGGAATIESNTLLKIRATLRATKSLIWSATGYQFIQWQDVKISASGGEIVFNPPRSDLQGWKDFETAQLIDTSAEGSFSHQYTLLVEYLGEDGTAIGIPPRVYAPFVIPEGDGVYDLDKSIVVGTVAGDQVSVPDSWDAKVSAAVAAAASAAASLLDSAQFVADEIGTDGTPANDVLIGAIAQGVTVATRGQEDTRRRIIARVPARPKLMASPPTVTVSAGNAATSISGGVIRAPKRLTVTGAEGAPVDMENDPLFTYLGSAPGKGAYGTVSPDNLLISWSSLTGVPTSQLASWAPPVGFQHTGSILEIPFKGLANPNYYRLLVNGEYATEDMQSITISSVGQVFRLIVDFGSVATRDIIVEFDSFRFGGVTIEPTASIVRLPPQPIRMAGVGDSFFGGAGELRRKGSVLANIAAQLGITEYWNLGVGGTGFINTGGTGGQTYAARINTDLAQTNPNLIVIAGGFNDRSNSAADIQAAATTDIASAKAQHPDALVFVVGVWSVGTPSAAESAANNAVRAAAAANGVPFIDVQDTAGVYGSAPTYSASTQYRIGDVVIYNGALYTSVAFSNAVAFDATKWRALSVVNGTGRVGATTGNGNADIATQSDGVHPTVLGGKLLGAFIARRIYEICKEIVTG